MISMELMISHVKILSKFGIELKSPSKSIKYTVRHHHRSDSSTKSMNQEHKHID